MPEEMYLQRLEKAKKYGGAIKVVPSYPLPTMQEAIEHTLDLTREEIIPVFDTVTDLKTCAEYYQKYYFSIMDVYLDLFSPSIYDNTCQEALFNFKVYSSVDEFSVAIRQQSKWIKERLFYKIKRGYEMDYGGLRLGRKKMEREQTALFSQLFNDPEVHAKALAELERRRQRNTEIIRGYGLL